MKCTHCGTELGQDDKLCGYCGKPAEAETPPTDAVEATDKTSVELSKANVVAETTEAPAKEANVAAETANVTTDAPATKKKSNKVAAIAIAAVAVIGVAAFAAVKMTEKDPKEVVIAAFENIIPEGQISPAEELFGTSEFLKSMYTTDTETSLSLKMDSCSDASVNTYAGAGIRFDGKNDMTNKKSSFNMGMTYNDMELATLNVYYGDEALMVSVPELVSKVLTLDLSEGLVDRVKTSPTIGAYLAQSGVDVDAMTTYLQELMDESVSVSENGAMPFDGEALLKRYREGCKAQDNFKAALAVEKNGKATFTMDGKEVNCTGYNVTVSKDSMIEFLRLSSDFFLQDETLKNDFLKQLETSVRMSEIMGAGAYGGTMQTPEELQQQTYEEAKEVVDEMITYLDDSLTDVHMVVYVDKSGRLASVDGKTSIISNADTSTDLIDGSVDVAFQWNLQGGAYLTQNMNGNLTLSNPDDATDSVSVSFTRQGTYDKTNLTDDISVDFKGASSQESASGMYSASYSAADGSYHFAWDLGIGGSQMLKLSVSGVIDELEKGKSLHLTIDELETSVMDNSFNIMMSGEYGVAPLSSTVDALDGEQMDVLSATPEDWQGLFMEGLFGAMAVMKELGIQ